MLSKYAIEVGQYCTSRLFRWPVIALWCLMAGLLLVAHPDLSPRGLIVSILFLGAAILLFRLWDDLADLEHDRIQHPQRVLVNTTELKPFVVALGVGMAALLLLLLSHPHRLVAFSVLLLTIGLVYHSAVGRALSRPARACIVLFKYPALLLIAAANASVRSLFVGVGLYAVVGVYEWLDDAELRNAPLSQIALVAVLGCVLIFAFALLVGVL